MCSVAQGAQAAMPGTQSATSGPSIIAINGDNPATISVGDSYSNLGAQITAPVADKNLDITTLVGGAATTSIQLDMWISVPLTILYTVTDPNEMTMGEGPRSSLAHHA